MKRLAPAFLFSLLLAGCMTTRSHADANTSSTRTSTAGRYQVSYEPAVNPIPKRQLHAWTIAVRDREGHPVDGAQLQIAGGMPDHGHGLPTKPYVREALGDGRYVVEGMKFNMGGYWVVDLEIASQAGADAVRFELNL
jgi:hypothetical protein